MDPFFNPKNVDIDGSCVAVKFDQIAAQCLLNTFNKDGSINNKDIIHGMVYIFDLCMTKYPIYLKYSLFI